MGCGEGVLDPNPNPDPHPNPDPDPNPHPHPHPHPNPDPRPNANPDPYQVWRLLAALLELGNLQFEEGGDDDAFGGCCPTDDAQLRRCAEQLGCEAGHLRD